jgi:Protein of unknown function (DUF3047)
MQQIDNRPTRKRALVVFLSIFALSCMIAGCATRDFGPAGTEVPPFSEAKPAAKFSEGWTLRQLSRLKRNTQYQLVKDASGVTVVEARADQSASGLQKRLNLDPTTVPWIQWRWNVPALITSADNTRRDKEDSPVRVVVTFDGDMKKLDFEDRAVSTRMKALTGQALPYATIMYIWENKMPVDSIIENAHTGRIKMIVVESGKTQNGKWIGYERNIVEDFERAFGEKPGRIKTIGIMTDTDNTGEKTLAYYGDIRFTALAKSKPVAPLPTLPTAPASSSVAEKKANESATTASGGVTKDAK